MRWKKSRMGRSAVFAAAVCCLLTVATVDAQSKKSAKEAESLENSGESAKAAVQDLSSISSDGLREKSANRLESARKRYASIGETLAKAREEFAPVVQNLNDQILFLGRDLSPEAVADLQDEAETLNQQAEEVTARVKALLQSAGETQDEAEADLEGDEPE